LVAALIAANLLGILGVVIAAPSLATITLLGRYTTRKMFDMNPWPEAEEQPSPSLSAEWAARTRAFFNLLKQTKQPKEKNNEQQ
jgi:hypothetical protein